MVDRDVWLALLRRAAISEDTAALLADSKALRKLKKSEGDVCFDEDLQRLPRRIVSEALDAADALQKNPELGDQLDPPLDRFRRLRVADRYRLVYTYDSATDSWWICLAEALELK